MKTVKGNQKYKNFIFNFILSIFLFSGASLLALEKKCSGKSWSLKKKSALIGADKTRAFSLGAESLIWCDTKGKFIGETSYYKMTQVSFRGAKLIKISLNQEDRGRGPNSPLILSSKTQKDANDFGAELDKKIQASLTEYNCNRNPSWTFKKKGAFLLSRTMTRKFYLGENSLYWCDNEIPKGYNPYLKMGRINNTQERIKIELIAEHRGRGKNNALILYPIDQLQIVRFIASLKDKKEKRFLLEFTLGAFKLKKSESKNEKKISNEEKLDKLETMANTTKQQRLKRGIEKAKILGRGLSKLAKKGITGKALDTYYWKEALSRDHFSKAIGGVRVAYLNSKVNREPFRISFQKDPIDNNANLYREGANTVFRTVFHSTHFSGPGTAIFVISPEKILYAGSHKVGQFHHSSFLAGSAVLAAGEIRTNSQGEITWFSNKSGHYRPEKKQVINALEFFKSKGVDLSQVIFYNMQTYRSTNAQKFLETNQ